jgi:hypothetical protein
MSLFGSRIVFATSLPHFESLKINDRLGIDLFYGLSPREKVSGLTQGFAEGGER